MITITTNCNDCTHKGLCRFEGNAETDMNKLKNMNYGNGPNDDYDWNTVSKSRNVNISFSCPDYRQVITSLNRDFGLDT